MSSTPSPAKMEYTPSRNPIIGVSQKTEVIWETKSKKNFPMPLFLIAAITGTHLWEAQNAVVLKILIGTANSNYRISQPLSLEFPHKQ